MPSRARHRLTVTDGLDQLEAALDGARRRQLLDALPGGVSEGMAALRHSMRTHAFATAGEPVSLRAVVDTLDARTRKEGLHVLHGWDYVAHRRPDDIGPVLLLDYCARLGVSEERWPDFRALLLDQYWTALLSLVAVRVWDDGDADRNMDRVARLLARVNGPDGSGHPVVSDIGSLLMLAVAYYHPEEQAYDDLLGKVQTLGSRHLLSLSTAGAGALGSHLRFGFRFMYRRDAGRMRDDNVVDYPWLLFALTTLMGEYERLRSGGHDDAERERVVEGLLDGLSADPWAFTGPLPPCMATVAPLHAGFRAALVRRRQDLLDDFGRIRPSPNAYSPVGLSCNFLSNAVVAKAAIAVADPTWYPSLTALFTRASSDGAASPAVTAEALARRLMVYASDPARLGAGGAPLIVYDPYDAVHYYNAVVRTLTDLH